MGFNKIRYSDTDRTTNCFLDFNKQFNSGDFLNVQRGTMVDGSNIMTSGKSRRTFNSHRNDSTDKSEKKNKNFKIFPNWRTTARKASGDGIASR